MPERAARARRIRGWITLSTVTCDMAMSVDGYVAGPDQDRDNPLGVGGRAVHEWHLGDVTHEADTTAQGWLMRPRGAYVMGRNMFGPIRGDWGDEDWRGWWGDEPPYHAPVFVLTHHARDSIEMAGGTTFHFVTGGIDEALKLAREVAGERNVAIAGGAATVNQFLARGLIDELRLHIAPVLLTRGERLFEGVERTELEQVAARSTGMVTHLTYAVKPC